MHQPASASSVSSSSTSGAPAASVPAGHSLLSVTTRSPDVGLGASLHATSQDALVAATEALAALAAAAAPLYDTTSASSSRASAPSSLANSAVPSPQLVPHMQLAPPPLAFVQHAPPSLLGPNSSQAATMPQPPLSHQPLAASLPNVAAPAVARRPPTSRAPVAAPKPTWVSLYDQKSDVDTDTETESDAGEEEPEAEESKSPQQHQQRQRSHQSRATSHSGSDSDLAGGIAAADGGFASRPLLASMSASSSSSSLHRAAAGGGGASSLRKGITSSLQGLSAAGLKEIEALVRKLQSKEKRERTRRNRHSSGASSAAGQQVEGVAMQPAGHSDQDNSSGEDDVASPSPVRHVTATHASPHPPPPAAHQQPVIASPGLGLPSLGMQRNWNLEFQSCFTAICNDATILDNSHGYSALSSLAHDFLWTASTLGRIIISEKQLPEHQKTIPSIDVGGYAGGLKYIAHNILFKFAVYNPDGLNGGDQFAAKAAGHELLGLSNYYRTIASSEGRLGLHVPLAALIDFRGYRLYATCKLPIDGTRTLVLGSMNGGHTILNASPEMNRKMTAVAEVLNLKVHTVTDGSGVRTQIPSCFDIEGHLGRDGRFYLVDFHRTFPPEPPAIMLQQHLMQEKQQQVIAGSGVIPSASTAVSNPSAPVDPSSPSTSVVAPIDLSTLHEHQSRIHLKNAYLYRLLRPELVRSYAASPLSSDVYSIFDRDSENHHHVMQCYRGLVETVIPLFARALEKNSPPQRFVDSGVQMQQQTANMIRNSSGGGGPSAGSAINQANAQLNTPRMSRASSISSMAPSPHAFANTTQPTTQQQQQQTPSNTNSNPPPSSGHSHLPPPALSLDVLSSVLHQSGINVRYLGLVRRQMQCPSWRSVLLVEILARLLKNDLRARWRAIKLRSMSDGPFRAHAVAFINLIFFPSLASNTYWAEHLHSEINLHFPGTLQGDECDPSKFHLKASLQGEKANTTTAMGAGGAPGGGGKARVRRKRSAFHECPVHHAGHTHLGVDPADPLSFLPPINASATAGEKAMAGLGMSDTAANASGPSLNPSMLRSPSTPSTGSTPPAFVRSVSTSVGYVRQASHLPATTAEHAPTSLGQHQQQHTPQQQRRHQQQHHQPGHHGVGGHHGHSASSPNIAAAANAGSKQNPQQGPRASGRPPSILDGPPQIPCTSLSCCSNGAHPRVDYLLLLFMRFIQLSGVVLEDGIVEAIQDAADATSSSTGSGVEPEDAESGLGGGGVGEEEHDGVGEGVLQLERTSMLLRDRQVSSSSSAGVPAPFPVHHRSVTEPRSTHMPNSPPPLQHALSQAAYPPLPTRGHANSPNAGAAAAAAASSLAASAPPVVSSSTASSVSNSPRTGFHRNLSISSLSLASTVTSPPSSHAPYAWRQPPGALAGGTPVSLYNTGGGFSGGTPISLYAPFPGYPASMPATPPSASGRSTPLGRTIDAQEGFPVTVTPMLHQMDHHQGRSRSNSGSSNSGATALRGGAGGVGPASSASSLLASTGVGGEIWNLWSWPFVAPLEEMHIRGVVERVKQVNTLWYAEGTSLLIKSWEMLQQHNRWLADQRRSSSDAASTTASAAIGGKDALPGGFTQKRFFLPGHLQSDEIFRDGPTPFLRMSFHLAGLAANKYQQALRYCLDDNLTLCNLSFLMSAVYNKYSSSFSYLRRAVLANPMHVRSWYYLGQLYHYHLHDRDQARFCYEKALSLAPNGSHANTLKDYGNLLQYTFHNPDAAEVKYRRALEVEPRHIKSLQLLATLTSRHCKSLKAFDEVKKYLYDAARSPMGIVETRLHAQEKYLHFVVCQAELYVEEHMHERAMIAKEKAATAAAAQQQQQQQQQHGGDSSTAAFASSGVNNLFEASKRWREAIDFLLCPHAHYGSSRDAGAGNDASTTLTNQSKEVMHALPAGLSSLQHGGSTSLTALTLPEAAAGFGSAPALGSSSSTTFPSAQPIQMMVTSYVRKPNPFASSATSLLASPSRNSSTAGNKTSASATTMLVGGEQPKKTASNEHVSSGSSDSSDSAAVSKPAEGFSWCVCADCCGAVHSDSLPLADTLLGYAQFIHTHEAVAPVVGMAGGGASAAATASYIAAKVIEAEKQYQWAIMVHHTLVTSRKRHKQVHMRNEMHPERASMAQAAAAAAQVGQEAHIGSGTTLYRVNSLTKTGALYHTSTHSSNAQEVIASPTSVAPMAYPFVPPAVKTAYLLSPPEFGSASASASPAAAASVAPSSAPPVSSATNSSSRLSPFLTPSWLMSLGLTPTFAVVVSKPQAVLTDAQMMTHGGAPLEAQQMRKLERLTAASSAAAASASSGGQLSILASISSPTASSLSIGSAIAVSGGSPAASTAVGVAPPTLSRPASSWDSSKKWTNLPAVIPTGAASSGQSGKAASCAAGGVGGHNLPRVGSTSAAVLAQIEQELRSAELALEIDLEYDSASTCARRCNCAVDHSFGEAATSCACSFPSPRYLMCYGFFLLRLGRFSQAAYVFQAALVIQPFGRTGSTCLARMIDAAVRAGILNATTVTTNSAAGSAASASTASGGAPASASSPASSAYAANLVMVYRLFKKAVGLEPFEAMPVATNRTTTTTTTADEDDGSESDEGDSSSSASSVFLPASLTACQLFLSFLKEHANALGPIAPVSTAPSTPTSTTSHGSATSTTAPPTIGLLLRDADLTIAAVKDKADQITSDLAALALAFKAKGGKAQTGVSSSYALALVNTACTCRRPVRGKPCLCRDQLLHRMISKTRQMRSRQETRRRAHVGELKHHDAATNHRRGRQGHSNSSSHHATNVHAHAPANMGNNSTSYTSAATSSGSGSFASASGKGSRGGATGGSGGGGGGRGGGRSGTSSSLGSKQHSAEAEKPASITGAEGALSASQSVEETAGAVAAGSSHLPKRENSWATMVAAPPKRNASTATTTAKEGSAPGAKEGAAAFGSVGSAPRSLHTNSSSGASTPLMKTPVSASPLLGPSNPPFSSSAHVSNLSAAPLTAFGAASTMTLPTSTATAATAAITASLPSGSQWWKAPLTLAGPPPAAAAAAAPGVASTPNAAVATAAPLGVMPAFHATTANSAAAAAPVVVSPFPLALSNPSTGAIVSAPSSATPFTFFSPPPSASAATAAGGASAGVSGAGRVGAPVFLRQPSSSSSVGGAAGVFAFKQSAFAKK